MPWNEPGSNDNNNDPNKGKPNGSNDPWGDRPRKRPQRGGDSPPDLDELIGELKDKFGIGRSRQRGNSGGKRQSSSGGGRPGGTAPSERSILGLIAIALLVLLIYNSFYTIQADQEGVVFRFSEYQETVGEGLHFKVPFIDTVEVVSTTVIRQVTVGQGGIGSSEDESRMVTEDVNIVIVPFTVQFDIKDPAALKLNVADDPNINTVVKQATESAVREVVGRSKMDYVLIDGREVIDAEAAVLAQQILDRYKTGINIISIETQGVKPPDEVKNAFDDFTRSLEDRDRHENEAQAYTNNVVPLSEGQAKRIIEDAAAYKDAVIAKAQGEASRFNQILSQYRQAPEVTRDRLYIESMESVLSNSSKIIVNQSSENVLLLPLDQMTNGNNESSGSTLDKTKAIIPSIINNSSTGIPANSSNNSQIIREGREGRN